MEEIPAATIDDHPEGGSCGRIINKHFGYSILPICYDVGAMPRKPKPAPDDPEQSKRFTEMARELGADEDPKAFERAFKRVTSSRKRPVKKRD